MGTQQAKAKRKNRSGALQRQKVKAQVPQKDSRETRQARIGRLGLYANLALGMIKAAGGYWFGSQGESLHASWEHPRLTETALLAEAAHSLSDSAFDLLTLLTVAISARAPTDRFPNGFGKVESLVSLVISAVLVLGGIRMGQAAAEGLVPYLPAAMSLVSVPWTGSDGIKGNDEQMSTDADGGNVYAALLAAMSVVVKEWLFRRTLRAASELGSSVLTASAWHHREDALAALVAFAVILLSRIVDDAVWMEQLGSLVVSLLITYAGCTNALRALAELGDVGVDKETVSQVAKELDRAVTEFSQVTTASGSDQTRVSSITGTTSGSRLLLNIVLEVPGGWSTTQTCQFSQVMRERVAKALPAAQRLNMEIRSV